VPRKRVGAWLPPNLYRAEGRFRYKAARWESWRMTEPEAIAEAIRRNALREDSSPNTVYRVIERFKVRLLKAGNAETTLSEKLRILRWYQSRIGDTDWRFIDRSVLRAKWQSMGPHAWAKHRSLWVDLFRFAIAEGICDQNEAEMALPPTGAELERVKGRHTQEGYDAIYKAAPEWLQIAMELAVSSLQDRSTLVVAKRSDVAGGVWKVTRGKTDAHLAITIPPGSRLAVAVQRALAFPVVGSYLIRRTPERRSHALDEFTQVRDELLSKAFAAARLKAEAYADVPIKQRPSFHGLRSFGSDLYRKAGYPIEYVNALMAHESIAMTEYYQSGYEVEYRKVEAGLGKIQ